MEIKKNPQASLENYSNQFLLIGLVLTLFCTYIVMEHKTYEKTIADLNTVILSSEPIEELIITRRRPIIKSAIPPPRVLEIIEIVQDNIDVNETIIESTETNENEAIVTNLDLNIDNINEATEYEEIIEDVPFAIIENIPIYPGCEKGTKAEKKACFSRKVKKHVHNEFNIELAKELGLTAGKKRIFVMFTINEKGKITEIKARAPHPRLQKEAKRVVQTLPKMTPGKQRGIAVRVKYALPITFEVIL
jgi:protein TonB